MRPGNLEDFGWNKIVRDLDRAIALARLSGIQSVLVQAAREASWGESAIRGEESKPFTLSPRGLAKVAGCHYTKVIEAQNDLISMGIFARTDDGQLVINKDYRTWVNTSKKLDLPPLFTAEQLEFICERRRKKTPKTGSENATTPVAKTLPHECSLVAKTLPTGSENATTPVAKTLPHECSLVAKTLPFDAGAVIGSRVHGRADARGSERVRELRDHHDESQKPLAQNPEFQRQLRDLNRWHQDTHPSDLSITHTHLSLLLAKAPDHPEWVKEAVEDSLLRAKGSKSTYAMACLTARTKDPEGWDRARRDGAKPTGPRLLPSQIDPPKFIETTAESVREYQASLARRRERRLQEADEKRRRLGS